MEIRTAKYQQIIPVHVIQSAGRAALLRNLGRAARAAMFDEGLKVVDLGEPEETHLIFNERYPIGRVCARHELPTHFKYTYRALVKPL